MLNREAINALPAQIALLDRCGVILNVNQAWYDFANENCTQPSSARTPSAVGCNYLAVCLAASQPGSVGDAASAAEALRAYHGLGAVLAGRLPAFSMEYACHTPQHMRWFSLSVNLCKSEAGGVVVAHANVTSTFLSNIALRQLTLQYQQSEQQRVQQVLRIEELSRSLLLNQEQSRRRFSHQLHDHTSANLAALRLNLDIIIASPLDKRDSQDFSDRVEDTRALIADTNHSIRDICAELHPPELDLGGLCEVVQSYVAQFIQRTGLAVQVHCTPMGLRLEPFLEKCLFRIVQEALTNCAKHACASLVQVSMQLGSQPMVLTISDNGIGFDTHLPGGVAHTRGQGLQNMQETAEFVGARLSIASQLGHGTCIGIEF